VSPAKQSLDALQAVPETHDLVPDEDDESRLDHRVEKCNEVVITFGQSDGIMNVKTAIIDSACYAPC
jgi:hypothetical protein